MDFVKQIISEKRLSRGEYLVFIIFLFVIIAFLYKVAPDDNNETIVVIKGIISLLFLFSYCYLTTKRLHDLGRSGLYIILLLVPLYNIYLKFIIVTKEGTCGKNKYGEDPNLFDDINKKKF